MSEKQILSEGECYVTYEGQVRFIGKLTRDRVEYTFRAGAPMPFPWSSWAVAARPTFAREVWKKVGWKYDPNLDPRVPTERATKWTGERVNRILAETLRPGFKPFCLLPTPKECGDRCGNAVKKTRERPTARR
jgi:hypothetical protein